MDYDYKLIAQAVTNGNYSHSSIAMAIRVLEILDAPSKTLEEVDEYLYGMRKHYEELGISITDEA